MFSKKPVVATTLSLLLAAGLAACSSNSGNGSSQSPGGASGSGKSAAPASATPTGKASGPKVKLLNWTSSRADTEYITQKIKAFNDTNTSNIEVEMTTMAENLAQSLDLAFASDQAPDVFQGPTPAQYEKGYIEPLNNYLDANMKEEFKSGFVEGSSMIKGNIISLANYGTTIRLVYNAEVFEKLGLKPPKTLNEMVEDAKKITEYGKKDGLYGWAMNYKSPASSLSRSLAAIAQGNGMTGFDYKTARYDFSGWKPIVEAFRKMMTDGSTLPGAESLDIDPLRAQFAEGKIGMYISYSYEPSVYKDQFPAKIKWAATPVPTINGGELTGVVDTGGTTWLAMSSKSKHKKEAWEFLKYMYSDDVLRGYHEGGYGLSVIPHIVQTSKPPTIKGMEYFLMTKYDGHWTTQGPTGLTLEGKDWYDVFMKYILTGGDLDAVIKDLNDRWNAALDKSIKAGTPQPTPIPNFDSRSLQIAQ